GPGSADARMDLKLLAHQTRRALKERWSAEAEARLAGLSSPDLWAGTIQDGTARGFKVALEEALSLCAPAPQHDPDPGPDPEDDVLEGKHLARRRDLLVASGGARIRFARKTGILFVDRKRNIHEDNCIWFEDRTDVGYLDGFVPKEKERPRLFSPAYLRPTRLVHGRARDELFLEGRLGRRRHGYPCHLRIVGRKDEDGIRLTVTIHNQHPDHRLRIRFLGFQQPDYFRDPDFPPWELVHTRGRTFLAATLVRACGRLTVADNIVTVPDAQCLCQISHKFGMGF
ncbi:MAG: hypothetical protein ACYTF5_13820, partial [Planctomycetota bacterium]